MNKSRSSKTPWTNSWPVLILLLIVFVLSAKAAWNSYSRKIFSREAALSKAEQLRKLEERQAFLAEELRKIDTADGREAVLRQEFGVGRPDEQLAIIVEAKPEENLSDSGNKVLNAIKTFFAELLKR